MQPLDPSDAPAVADLLSAASPVVPDVTASAEVGGVDVVPESVAATSPLPPAVEVASPSFVWTSPASGVE
jgi:hypothetical protein